MNVDETIWVDVITPKGLVVKVEWENLPKQVRDLFGHFDRLTQRQIEERAVACMSRLTGCRCTLQRSLQVTCDADSQVGLEPELR